MKSSAIRYGVRFGCRWGAPHDFQVIKDAKKYKVEKCKLCGVVKRWNKGYQGRIDNNQYLKDHVRQYAQKSGSTKRVYAKMYQKEKTIIYI